MYLTLMGSLVGWFVCLLICLFVDLFVDLQCREVGYESHEELLKVLHELHTAMKTSQSYQVSWAHCRRVDGLSGAEAIRAMEPANNNSVVLCWINPWSGMAPLWMRADGIILVVVDVVALVVDVVDVVVVVVVG